MPYCFVDATELASTDSGEGAALVGFKQSGTGAVSRTVESKLREECSLWDVIPDAYRADIEAGTSTQDVIGYINQALQNHRRVIVRRGVYRFSTPILFAFSEQCIEFEDGAWLHPLNGTTNGIARPHGLLDCRLINPGLIGEAGSATGATAIFWNTLADGSDEYGSLTPDAEAGYIEHARFKQASAAKAWTNFLHSNMVDGLTVKSFHGRGLYGTVSDTGYGLIASGTNTTLRDIDVDAVIANQGRHGIYLGDQCAGADLLGFRISNFEKSGLSVNTGTTDANDNIGIAKGLLKDVCMAEDTSGTNSAMDLTYQGGATHGGRGLTISDIQVDVTGVLGIYLRGYDKAALSNIVMNDWGQTGAGGAGVALCALRVLEGDNVVVTNFQSFTDVANSGSTTIQHVKVQESSNFRLTGGGAFNTGSGAQHSAVHLDATGIGTPNAIIDRFVGDKGSGSWSNAAYANPTQNGSVVVYPKTGRIKTDTQTGANLVLDVSGGETMVRLDASASSVLDMTAAGPGQAVTLECNGNTTVKATNFYLAGSVDFSGTANDTIALVYNGGAWREVGRSVN